MATNLRTSIRRSLRSSIKTSLMGGVAMEYILAEDSNALLYEDSGFIYQE
jgi:hypothetical protein